MLSMKGGMFKLGTEYLNFFPDFNEFYQGMALWLTLLLGLVKKMAGLY